MNKKLFFVGVVLAVVIVSGCTGPVTPSPSPSPAAPSSVPVEVDQVVSDLDDSGIDQTDGGLADIDFL